MGLLGSEGEFLGVLQKGAWGGGRKWGLMGSGEQWGLWGSRKGSGGLNGVMGCLCPPSPPPTVPPHRDQQPTGGRGGPGHPPAGVPLPCVGVPCHHAADVPHRLR